MKNLDVALLVLLGSVLAIFLTYVIGKIAIEGDSQLPEWAKRNAFRVLRKDTSPVSQGWSRIVVEDQEGNQRSGWITFGLLSGKEDVLWDEQSSQKRPPTQECSRAPAHQVSESGGAGLWPYTSFMVALREPLPEVVRRLSEQVSRWRWFARLPYSGSVWRSGFKIMRVTRYMNSFMPVLCGRFEASSEGTTAHITMRPHWGVLAFLCGWCGALGTGFIAMLKDVTAGVTPWGILLAPFFMALFAVGLTLGGFWWEAPRRREEITQILVGEVEPSARAGSPPGSAR
jgi:hypothetical protein